MPATFQTQKGDPPPLVIAAVAIALVAAVVGLFLVVRQLDASQRIFGRTTDLGPPRVIVRLSTILDEPRRSTLRGRYVQLQDVPVQSVSGDTLFWIGPSRNRRIPVLWVTQRAAGQPEARVRVEAGTHVTLTGLLLETGAALLSSAERARLKDASIVVYAMRVVP